MVVIIFCFNIRASHVVLLLIDLNYIHLLWHKPTFSVLLFTRIFISVLYFHSIYIFIDVLHFPIVPPRSLPFFSFIIIPSLPLLPHSWEPDVTYSLRVFTSGCYYFDEALDEWSNRGLEVRRLPYILSSSFGMRLVLCRFHACDFMIIVLSPTGRYITIRVL